jgi:hypothetical protein
MKAPSTVAIFAWVMLIGLLAAYPVAGRAQESMKDAVATFAFDLHEGMKRANLTPQQKQQIRDDLRTLREAHQNGNRREALRAMMNFHRLLDSGAFQPQDQQRISQDLQNLRQAKKEAGGTGMGGGMGMGGTMGGMR